jgi:3'(2'), 5'-bisphosphate nucleotidase
MSEELKYAIEVAKEAGKLIMEFYGRDISVETKSNDTPVTEADKAVDKFIREKLQQKFTYPVLSEEAKDDLSRLGAETIWIVDPIDGTSGFIKKNGFFSVHIGLAKKSGASLGVVYRPTEDELQFAERGKGAYIHKKDETPRRMRVSNVGEIKRMKLVLHASDKKYEIEKGVARDLGIIDFINVSAAGIRIGVVSNGESAICINAGEKSSEWDTCAPQVILEESGGKITDICGNELFYNQKNVRKLKGFLATNGLVHNEALEIISKMPC